MSNKNLQNYVNFDNLDVLITTPQQFEVINSFKRIKNLKPEFVVLDEADELLSTRSEIV